jgi:hypothetical protein
LGKDDFVRWKNLINTFLEQMRQFRNKQKHVACGRLILCLRLFSDTKIEVLGLSKIVQRRDSLELKNAK